VGIAQEASIQNMERDFEPPGVFTSVLQGAGTNLHLLEGKLRIKVGIADIAPGNDGYEFFFGVGEAF
jgi:hypothetical protein